MSDKKDVTLPDLTDAQLELLRERFRIEEGITTAPADEPADVISVQRASDVGNPYKDDAVFTNFTAGLLIIDDLGIKSPSGRFTPETFQPFETKDLRRLYTPRELRASKYLVIAQDPHEHNGGQPLLKRGKFSKEEILKLIGGDALATLATDNPKGTFEDPEFGKTVYDKKLQEVEMREHQEDLETRKGPRQGVAG